MSNEQEQKDIQIESVMTNTKLGKEKKSVSNIIDDIIIGMFKLALGFGVSAMILALSIKLIFRLFGI